MSYLSAISVWSSRLFSANKSKHLPSPFPQSNESRKKFWLRWLHFHFAWYSITLRSPISPYLASDGPECEWGLSEVAHHSRHQERTIKPRLFGSRVWRAPDGFFGVIFWWSWSSNEVRDESKIYKAGKMALLLPSSIFRQVVGCLATFGLYRIVLLVAPLLLSTATAINSLITNVRPLQ